jgi:hypothetical protein
MSIIDPELRIELSLHPYKEFNVLITLKEGCNAESLNLKEFKVIMDNILLAELNAGEIYELENSNNIISIEKDTEMGIL